MICFDNNLFHWLVVDKHKLTVFYLKSFDVDSVQVGKAEIKLHNPGNRTQDLKYNKNNFINFISITNEVSHFSLMENIDCSNNVVILIFLV